jgi:hypothetical protein
MTAFCSKLTDTLCVAGCPVGLVVVKLFDDSVEALTQ